MKTSSDRLKRLREEAGFETAADAVNRYHWTESTYRSHENGQTKVPVAAAQKYAEAFKKKGESTAKIASWILLGDQPDDIGSALAGLHHHLAEQIEDEVIAHEEAFPPDVWRKIDDRLKEIDEEIGRLQKEQDELLAAKRVRNRFLDEP